MFLTETVLTERVEKLEAQLAALQEAVRCLPIEVRNMIDRDETNAAAQVLGHLSASERVRIAQRLVEHTSWKVVPQ